MLSDLWPTFGILLAFSLFRCNALPPQINDHSLAEQSANERPIIGILSLELTRKMAAAFPDKQSYIAASYVKYIESAGARVVPIKINQPDEYYTSLFDSINGLLIPGGGVDLIESGYARAGTFLYHLAISANQKGDHFPIWGTCLGFELLSVITAGDRRLTECSCSNRALPLHFRPSARSSRLYGNAPEEIMDTLSNDPSTSNFHVRCLTPDNFTASGLDSFYDISATSQDDNGLTFIASIEAKNYPIWGVQFHPEKNIYEWRQTSIPHSAKSVAAGQYFANFFVNEARRSGHRFSSSIEEDPFLIYNSQPVFTRNITTSFEQCYFLD